ncbi:MAG: SPOR domain-containing protein [Desulfosarcinaceae bacterium]
MSKVLRLGLVWALVCLSYPPVAVADATTYAVPGVYSVQVAAYSQRASAEAVVADLHTRGYRKAYVFQHTSLKQRTTWYVARLGDFGTLAAALQTAEAYGSDAGKTVLITPPAGKPHPRCCSRGAARARAGSPDPQDLVGGRRCGARRRCHSAGAGSRPPRCASAGEAGGCGDTGRGRCRLCGRR